MLPPEPLVHGFARLVGGQLDLALGQGTDVVDSLEAEHPARGEGHGVPLVNAHGNHHLAICRVLALINEDEGLVEIEEGDLCHIHHNCFSLVKARHG